MLNWPTPITKENQQPRAKLRLANARKSTTGQPKVRQRMMNPMPESPEIQAQILIASSPNQSQRAPSSRT
jgi:hypothetical protein